MATILVADDSDMMRKIAKMSLEKGGHSVVEAHDGAEAVSLAKEKMPSLIMLDAEMPEMDGWEACKTIRADQQTANIPVLMCTGHDLAEESDQLTQAGATGYVTKPYNPVNLLAKIQEVLNG